MRFCGYGWRHNPREIRFECEKRINERQIPYGESLLQNMGSKCMVVRGEGELCGDDCTEQFGELLRLFRESQTGVLCIDRLRPMFAVFEELRLLGSPRENVLGYSFVFREAADEKSRLPVSSYITAEGENLWDVSYRFGIPIDSLVRLNPKIKRPDIVGAGTEVRLAEI